MNNQSYMIATFNISNIQSTTSFLYKNFMRIKMVNRIFLYLFIFGSTIMAQSNLEHVLKVYPNWETYFKVTLIEFSEQKSILV